MTPLTPPRPLVAVILAGGRARRMGGIDKTLVDIGGRSSLARVIDAAPTRHVVVLGPDPDVPDGVHRVLEEERFSGPVAALERGVREVPHLLGEADLSQVEVLILGADMPHLRREHLQRLVDSDRSDPGDAAVRIMIGEGGRRENLCAVWPLALLRERLNAVASPDTGWANLPMKALLESLAEERILEVASLEGETTDIDTPQDLLAARQRSAALDHPDPASGSSVR